MEKKFIGNGLEISDLNAIAEILKANDLERIKIKNNDFEIVLESKRKCPRPAPMGMMGMGMQPAMPAPQQTESAPQAGAEVSGNKVKAPIVGTFYASASPDSKPFVTEGQKVSKGDTIYIIESMKVMSEIQSEFDGVVKKICVKNGDAVEFDQTVMIIE